MSANVEVVRRAGPDSTTSTAAPRQDAAPPVAARFSHMQAIVALGAIQVLAMIAGIARVKVLAVLLGPAGVGVAGVVDQVVSLVVQVGSLSIPFAALKFVSRARSIDAGRVNGLLGALATLLLATSAAAALIAVVLVLGWPGLFGSGLRAYREVVFAGLVGVPAVTLGSMLRNVLAALGGHKESAMVGLVAAIALVAASYIGVEIGGLEGLFIGNLVVAILTVAVTYVYLRRRFGVRATRNSAGTLRAVREEPGLARFAASLYVLALTSPLTYLASRSLVLGRFGADAAGFLAAAYGIALAIRLVLNQANGLYLTPLVNRQAPTGERVDASIEYLRILLVLFMLVATAVVLFPRDVLLVLYQARFAPAIGLVGVFVIAEGLLLLAGVYQTLLVGMDDIFGFLSATVAGHMTTLVLVLPLARRWEAFGVGVAFAAGNATIFGLCAVRLALRHGVARARRPARLVTTAMAVLALASWFALSGGGARVLPRLAAYALVAAATLAVLTRQERAWLLRPGTLLSGRGVHPEGA